MFKSPFYNQKNFMVGIFRQRTPLPYSLSGPSEFFKLFNKGRELKFYKDGPTSSVAVIESDKLPSYDQTPMSIIVNGKSDSCTVTDIYTLKLSAHIPALLAENRERAMVIGLGTGVTAGELSLYPEIKYIDVAEISPTVAKVLPYFQEGNHNVHQDPRLNIHIGDAFRVLGRSQKTWDIIISEPSNPWVTGVDQLYTEEFYKLVKAHLTAGGIFLQWIHVYAANPQMVGMVVNTARREFKECHVFMANPGDLLIVLSKRKLSKERLRKAEEVFNTHKLVKSSLKKININSFDAILIREIWTTGYIANTFSDFGIQSQDNPYLHYLAGKAFFMGRSVPQKFLFGLGPSAYFHEFLLAMKHNDWQTMRLSRKLFDSLYLSTRDKIYGRFLPMASALRLKAYLSNPSEFPLSEIEKERFQVKLIPFIAGKDKDWSKIGPGESSFRQKAQIMINHIKAFRNWVVPYPIDGLKTVLREGIINGKDVYERNWCAIRLALILIWERADREEINRVINQIVKGKDGRVILKEKDKALLEMLKRKWEGKNI